jgi:Lrp/AsnC family transcriptional regulator, regulator for asnA, asnC and gidA
LTHRTEGRAGSRPADDSGAARARVDPMLDRARLDAADKHIIALLQINGRATYTELAAKVGLSEASVRKRVRELRDRQVIQIVAVTDPLQLGFSHEALIAIHTVEDPQALADRLAEIDDVDFVVLVAGRYSILLEVVATDDDEFIALIQRIRQLATPARVDVLPYLLTRKQAYAWGVR